MLETNVVKFYLLTQLLSLSSAAMDFQSHLGGGGGGAGGKVLTQATSKRTAASPEPPSTTDSKRLFFTLQTSYKPTTTWPFKQSTTSETTTAQPKTNSEAATSNAKSTTNRTTQVRQNQVAMQGGDNTFDPPDWVNGHIALVAGVLVAAGIAVLILIIVWLIKSLCGAAKVDPNARLIESANPYVLDDNKGAAKITTHV